MTDIFDAVDGVPTRHREETDVVGGARVHSYSRAVDVRGEHSTTIVNTTASTTGDNQIVAAPGAGNRIIVLAFVMQNESATPTTMILRSAATSNGWRFLGQNQGDGLSKDFALARPWKLGTNEALNLNLDGNNSCSVSVMYYTETV